MLMDSTQVLRNRGAKESSKVFGLSNWKSEISTYMGKTPGDAGSGGKNRLHSWA